MARRRLARLAAPVAFLAAIAIGILVVRSGLQQGSKPATTRTATTRTHTAPKHPARRHRRTYTVQSGDTFATIASKLGTSVARLEHLNPGVDPSTLRIGQKIRVQ